MLIVTASPKNEFKYSLTHFNFEKKCCIDDEKPKKKNFYVFERNNAENTKSDFLSRSLELFS